MPMTFEEMGKVVDRATADIEHLRKSLTTALTECAAWKMSCTLAKEERDAAIALLKEINGRAQIPGRGFTLVSAVEALRDIREKCAQELKKKSRA